MGRNDLIDIGFLEAGFVAGRSVGRITVRDSGKRGTGFLVSPQLLMTNNHVLRSVEEAARAFVEFNFQDGLDRLPLQPVGFLLQPERFFVTDRVLDFSVVAVAPTNAEGAELGAFGWLALIEAEGKVVKGELVNIIQHPNGEPKQLALRENRVVDLLEQFLHYETDTAPGSSGSPVFNDRWEVVALHHSGVPKRDAEGKLLALDGSRWSEDMGENRLVWVANEGARISRVLRALRERPMSANAAELRAQLGGVPGSVRSSVTVPAPLQAGISSSATTEQLPSGASRFTIPLHVTVSLSRPAQPTAAPAEPHAAVVDSSAASLAPEAPQLRAALANLEAARARPYYDAEADTRAREAYYQDVDAQAGAESAAFFGALSDLLTHTHTPTLDYKPMRLVYPWVDQHPDRRLRSVYSGKIVDPEDFIREDVAIALERSLRLEALVASEAAADPGVIEAEFDALEAELPFNCEHVVPQSWFAKREPMKGDLHHLFACETRCNSFRGSLPFRDFADLQEKIQSDCGRSEPDGFEPVAGKGPVARSTLYFLLRYPGHIGDEARELQRPALALLLDWHFAEPVGEYERHRNAAIAELQGNRNPLIDHPEWADVIRFDEGFHRGGRL